MDRQDGHNSTDTRLQEDQLERGLRILGRIIARRIAERPRSGGLDSKASDASPVRENDL